uniref:Uncharacterized protein n=1 Tax=Chromera velia CCMP2878 TaxID=1169474 RepID=A0A0G4F3R2_9ALVE|eukprot:Cvel_14917.t1-p1 / transcript=Cvel_14917.t1 / gene=Cvel_14917 / organism=Chromera_velia_CCMP2878 / gene_product=hypothetical protein / transcript_product=hypothetical protein / location=Cvel_scaffold1081:6358-7789(-) / protein_length=439 / sequence_SO=supercontig / SO=protein_coding / is_pseudo=false
MLQIVFCLLFALFGSANQSVAANVMGMGKWKKRPTSTAGGVHFVQPHNPHPPQEPSGEEATAPAVANEDKERLPKRFYPENHQLVETGDWGEEGSERECEKEDEEIKDTPPTEEEQQRQRLENMCKSQLIAEILSQQRSFNLLKQENKDLKATIGHKRVALKNMRERSRYYETKSAALVRDLINASDTPSLLKAAALSLEEKKGEGEAVFFSAFLKNLAKNEAYDSKGRRHEKAVKDFATHVLHWGGQKVFDFLEKNLEGFPSRKTIERHAKVIFLARPGLSDETLDFVAEQFKGKLVHMAEDATRMKNIMEAHDGTGQLFGFISKDPFSTHVPVVGIWEELRHEYDNYDLGKYVYTFCITPVDGEKPPICIATFLTDNKFNTADVKCPPFSSSLPFSWPLALAFMPLHISRSLSYVAEEAQSSFEGEGYQRRLSWLRR